MDLVDKKEGLAELMERGGLHQGIRGTMPREVLSDFIRTLPLAPSVEADKLLAAVMEREALMSTSVGHGIALPHPRNPLVRSQGEQFVALGFLDESVDWNSLDGEPVDTLLLIVSASAKEHLQTLSKINFFCRQEDFRRLLKERVPQEELLRYIREAEKNWS